MQTQMNHINTNLATMNQRTNTIQSTLKNVSTNMQSNITDAIVAAMSQFWAFPSNGPSQHEHTLNAPSTRFQPPATPATSNTNHGESYASPTTHQPHVRFLQPSSQPPDASFSDNHRNNHSNSMSMTDLVNITTGTKCVFNTYTKNQNILEWQTLCILELSSSNKSIHNNIVQYNEEGNPYLPTQLPKAENQELFRLTRNALSHCYLEPRLHIFE